MGISTVTSEALQLKLRQLLPSQQGFGTDLSASDTIIPVIDLTRAAEGSDVPEYLQTATGFATSTGFEVTGTTTTIISTTGFYRILGMLSCKINTSATVEAGFQITDGATDTILYKAVYSAGAENIHVVVPVDFVVFISAGQSVKVICSTNAIASGSTRQLADKNGVLVNPVGFNPQ